MATNTNDHVSSEDQYSSGSWTDNYSSSTGTTGDIATTRMLERWNNNLEIFTGQQHHHTKKSTNKNSWTAAVSELIGGAFGVGGRTTSSHHSLIEVKPHRSRGLDVPPHSSKRSQQSLFLKERQRGDSLFASASIRSHATAKSKESEMTIPLSNLTKHVRARREEHEQNIIMEEGEDASSTTDLYLENGPVVVQGVAVVQSASSESKQGVAPESQYQPLPPRRPWAKQLPDTRACPPRHPPLPDPMGITATDTTQDPHTTNKMPNQQQQPSPEKQLVADAIAASLRLPTLNKRSTDADVPQPTKVVEARDPSPPTLSSAPSISLHQPVALRPSISLSTPDSMDTAVRLKIASLKASLEPAASIQPSPSDAPASSTNTSRPDAPPRSSSNSSSDESFTSQPAEEAGNEQQEMHESADIAEPPNQKRSAKASIEKKGKKESLQSLVYTSCSEDEDDGILKSCTSPTPISSILESTLLSSPISNVTTDMRLVVAARHHHRQHDHREEKKQADDDADNTTKAVVAKHKQRPQALSTPSMRLVENVHLKDPYGDTGVYSGVLVRSKPESHGTMRYEDGRIYTGSWKRGRWHGYGKSVFANGDSYMGEYEADIRNGIGRYEWADGRVFDGRFENDQREGSGTYCWPNGSVYIGNFHSGLRHGSGTFTFADGSVYSGEWENGKQHGTGECVWKDGRCYRGTWVKGRAHGYGVEVRADGSLRHEGQWENDRPMKSSRPKETKK